MKRPGGVLARHNFPYADLPASIDAIKTIECALAAGALAADLCVGSFGVLAVGLLRALAAVALAR